MISVGRPDDRGPRSLDTQQSFNIVSVNLIAQRVHKQGLNTRHGIRSIAWFCISDPCHRAYHDPSCFSLPPGVDEMCMPSADTFMIPVPRLLIDRLTYRANHAKGRQIVALRILITGGHQGPDGSGGRVKNIHFVFFADLPKSGWIRECRDAFKHERSGTIQQRSIEDITMAGNPSDIRRTPINITRSVLKYIFKRVAGIHHIPASGVNHSCRLAGRA